MSFDDTVLNLTMKPLVYLSVALGLVATLSGCRNMATSILCSSAVQSNVPSPDGRYIVEVLWEDCGATEHATAVTIRRARWFSLRDNLFVVESFHPMGLSWSSQTLKVICGDCKPEDVGQVRRKWLDVTVQYHLPKSGLGSSETQ